MTLTIRTILLALVLGLAAVLVAPLFASAQASTAQLIVVTKTMTGTAPSSSGTVFVTGTGPSLSGTTTSSGNLSYASSFSNDTRVVTLVPGSYSTAASLSGYTQSYSSQCSGYLAAGEVRTCTITAGTGGSARVNVAVGVTNDNGGVRMPNDFLITVSGQNASVSSFQGSNGSVQVTLGAGSYSIDISSASSYTVSRSLECTGVISDGETRSCVITLNDNPSYGNTNPNYYGRLSCTPSRQSAGLGSTVSFTAQGGNGVYTWTTADRSYYAVGSVLNAQLGTVGTQSVYVTSGYETASCIVDVVGTGSVLGSSTKIPGLPNTGYGPSTLTLILALLGAFVALPVALMVAYPHVRKTTASLFR